jgi:hypothetical protein
MNPARIAHGVTERAAVDNRRCSHLRIAGGEVALWPTDWRSTLDRAALPSLQLRLRARFPRFGGDRAEHDAIASPVMAGGDPLAARAARASKRRIRLSAPCPAMMPRCSPASTLSAALRPAQRASALRLRTEALRTYRRRRTDGALSATAPCSTGGDIALHKSVLRDPGSVLTLADLTLGLNPDPRRLRAPVNALLRSGCKETGHPRRGSAWRLQFSLGNSLSAGNLRA